MLMRKIVGGVSVRNILIISLLAALAVSLTSCYIMREEVTGEVPLSLTTPASQGHTTAKRCPALINGPV